MVLGAAGLALLTKRTTPGGPVFTTTGSWLSLRSEACLGPDRGTGGNPRAWQEGSLAGLVATGLWKVEELERVCVYWALVCADMPACLHGVSTCVSQHGPARDHRGQGLLKFWKTLETLLLPIVALATM